MFCKLPYNSNLYLITLYRLYLCSEGARYLHFTIAKFTTNSLSRDRFLAKHYGGVRSLIVFTCSRIYVQVHDVHDVRMSFNLSRCKLHMYTYNMPFNVMVILVILHKYLDRYSHHFQTGMSCHP